MKLSRVLLLIVIVGSWLCLGPNAKAQQAPPCYNGTKGVQCQLGSCKQNITGVILQGDTYVLSGYGITFCCGVAYATTSDPYPDWCLITQLRDPRVEERLMELSNAGPLYIPNCDGWLRPFRPLVNESRKPS